MQKRNNQKRASIKFPGVLIRLECVHTGANYNLPVLHVLSNMPAEKWATGSLISKNHCNRPQIRRMSNLYLPRSHLSNA